MTRHDLLRSSNGGEIHAGIPTHKQIEVRRYLLELRGAQGRSVVQERSEQHGDMGWFHEGVIVEAGARVEARGVGYLISAHGGAASHFSARRPRSAETAASVQAQALEKSTSPDDRTVRFASRSGKRLRSRWFTADDPQRFRFATGVFDM